MLLLSHIIIALAGMVFVALAFIAPSKTKLDVSYAFAALTFLTGTILTVVNPSHLAAACVSGLIYFGVVGVIIAATRAKLATEKVYTKQD